MFNGRDCRARKETSEIAEAAVVALRTHANTRGKRVAKRRERGYRQIERMMIKNKHRGRQVKVPRGEQPKKKGRKEGRRFIMIHLQVPFSSVKKQPL